MGRKADDSQTGNELLDTIKLFKQKLWNILTPNKSKQDYRHQSL